MSSEQLNLANFVISCIQVSGFQINADELKNLATQIKRHCGTGGSVKDGVIMIQGDHRDTLVTELKNRGFKAKTVRKAPVRKRAPVKKKTTAAKTKTTRAKRPIAKKRTTRKAK